MNFEEFRERLIADLNYRYRGYQIEPVKVEKTNQSYEGISIKPYDSNLGICINLEDYNLPRKEDYNYLLSDILERIANAFTNKPNIDAADLDISDYEKVKNRLCMELISAERNAALLKTVPHKNLEDLAIVYSFLVEKGDSVISIPISNKMLESYGLSAEQLHEDALQIAPRNLPACIKSMRELTGAPFYTAMDEMMFVVTSDISGHFGYKGASAVAYPGFLEHAADVIGSDYYVIPSSIHEVILLKDFGMGDPAELIQLVKYVNQTEVLPEEFLSNNVYHYDPKNKTFETIDKFRARTTLS